MPLQKFSLFSARPRSRVTAKVQPRPQPALLVPRHTDSYRFALSVVVIIFKCDRRWIGQSLKWRVSIGYKCVCVCMCMCVTHERVSKFYFCIGYANAVTYCNVTREFWVFDRGQFYRNREWKTTIHIERNRNIKRIRGTGDRGEEGVSSSGVARKI